MWSNKSVPGNWHANEIYTDYRPTHQSNLPSVFGLFSWTFRELYCFNIKCYNTWDLHMLPIINGCFKSNNSNFVQFKDLNGEKIIFKARHLVFVNAYYAYVCITSELCLFLCVSFCILSFVWNPLFSRYTCTNKNYLGANMWFSSLRKDVDSDNPTSIISNFRFLWWKQSSQFNTVSQQIQCGPR